AGCKLGRIERKQGDAVIEVLRKNTILKIAPGERVATVNPGGGGWGPALEREIGKVVHDVRNGYVSLAAAEQEYGVIVDVERWTGRRAGARHPAPGV
ncbi:hydantoinase B/oxoprolinase family protein, partial [Verminephrobacter eiseniae]|nr:hydantoinase B/oxoprolinase family protein [Verminephrobacter eiseniae]